MDLSRTNHVEPTSFPSMTGLEARGEAVEVVHVNFSKAFDTVSCDKPGKMFRGVKHKAAGWTAHFWIQPLELHAVAPRPWPMLRGLNVTLSPYQPQNFHFLITVWHKVGSRAVRSLRGRDWRWVIWPERNPVVQMKPANSFETCALGETSVREVNKGLGNYLKGC